MNLKNIIFKNEWADRYWISSRCFVTSDSTCHNVILVIKENRVGEYCLVDGSNNNFGIESGANHGNNIRPIINLKPNIQVKRSESNANMWILK